MPPSPFDWLFLCTSVPLHCQFYHSPVVVAAVVVVAIVAVDLGDVE